jgi:hypothetical protein
MPVISNEVRDLSPIFEGAHEGHEVSDFEDIIFVLFVAFGVIPNGSYLHRKQALKE